MSELTFFTYCRKSSEDATRQVASIGDQMAALTKVIESEGLTVVGNFSEEKSSKEPGREQFNAMLDQIDRGEANGILCWDIDRLYRNPVDEGRLRWMLQRGVIKVIKTPYRSFYPEDAGLLMGVEGGRATDYIIRLSKNVKRGLNSKAKRGWRPSGGPMGYRNIGTEKGNKTIDIDPERFDIVRRMWDHFLTGQYSVREINLMASEKWGLRTPQRRKLGGKKLSMSHMYRIFNDPFYTGKFLWKDPETGEETLHQGKHQPMITVEEFERAQVLLGAKGKPQPHFKEFAYTGLVRCGECDSSVTAEEKNQVICSECSHKFSNNNRTDCPKCHTDISEMKNPKILKYVYYRCSKKKGHCKQKYLRNEEFEKQFSEVLSKLTIDKRYIDVAIDYLRDTQDVEIQDYKKITESLRKQYVQCEDRIQRLNKEFTSPQNADYSIYSQEEFREYKAELRTEKDRIKKEIEKAEKRTDDSFDIAARTFNFCALAKKCFDEGDLRMKRLLLNTIGSNITLKDKKLDIQLLYPFQVIINELNSQSVLKAPLEPENTVAVKGKTGTFVPVHPTLLRR